PPVPGAQRALPGIATPLPTEPALAPPVNAVVGSEVPEAFKNEIKTVASGPRKTAPLGDLPALGTTRRDEEDAARNPFGLKPTAPASTAGDDLSKWDLAKVETSDKLSKSIAPAPNQQAGKEFAFNFDRNGKADQPQAGGRTAGEGGLYGVNAVGYANITNRFAAAIDEALPAPGERTEERAAAAGTVQRSVSEQNAEETLARQNPSLGAEERSEERRMGIWPESRNK